LSFPSDAAVYPVRDVQSGRSQRLQQLVWTADQQRLESGYLQSRTTGQFLVVRPARSSAHLEVHDRSDGEVAVINRLNTDIHQLLLCDAAAGLFRIEGLADGEEGLATPISPAEAKSWLAGLFEANRPELPEGFDPVVYRRRFGLGFRRRIFRFMGTAAAQPTFATSVLERQLSLARGTPERLTPRSYVAIVEAPHEVPLGVSTARQVASFHVLAGRW
jgi:hypothetical protein